MNKDIIEYRYVLQNNLCVHVAGQLLYLRKTLVFTDNSVLMRMEGMCLCCNHDSTYSGLITNLERWTNTGNQKINRLAIILKSNV